jgi:flagellar protein FliS
VIPNAIAARRYKAVQVKTSSPGDILVMLYDGVFRFLGEARTAMANDDRARAGDRINRAHAILTEFTAGLNHSVAPELCANLQGVYMFSMGHLLSANLTQDPTKIDEVMRVLTPLREGFKEAVRQNASQGGQP